MARWQCCPRHDAWNSLKENNQNMCTWYLACTVVLCDICVMVICTYDTAFMYNFTWSFLWNILNEARDLHACKYNVNYQLQHSLLAIEWRLRVKTLHFISSATPPLISRLITATNNTNKVLLLGLTGLNAYRTRDVENMPIPITLLWNNNKRMRR